MPTKRPIRVFWRPLAIILLCSTLLLLAGKGAQASRPADQPFQEDLSGQAHSLPRILEFIHRTTGGSMDPSGLTPGSLIPSEVDLALEREDCKGNFLDYSSGNIPMSVGNASSCNLKVSFIEFMSKDEQHTAVVEILGFQSAEILNRNNGYSKAVLTGPPLGFSATPGSQMQTYIPTPRKNELTPAKQAVADKPTAPQTGVPGDFIYKAPLHFHFDALRVPAVSDGPYIMLFKVAFDSGSTLDHSAAIVDGLVFYIIHGRPYFFFKFVPAEKPHLVTTLLTRSTYLPVSIGKGLRITSVALNQRDNTYLGAGGQVDFVNQTRPTTVTGGLKTSLSMTRISLTSSFQVFPTHAPTDSINTCVAHPASSDPYCVHIKYNLSNLKSFCLAVAAFVLPVFHESAFSSKPNPIARERCPA